MPCWILLLISFRIQSYYKNGKLAVVGIHVSPFCDLAILSLVHLVYFCIVEFYISSWIFYIWKECVIHAIFFPTPCSVFTHSGSHVPGNFLISHDRLIRYDHTFIYLVILIQVKGFQVILNITLKCPRFLNTVFLHCYSLQRGIIKASWAP